MDLGETVWRKASGSHENGDQCVEIAAMGGVTLLRDSKAPTALRSSLSRR
jgi:hypothetical protein